MLSQWGKNKSLWNWWHFQCFGGANVCFWLSKWVHPNPNAPLASEFHYSLKVNLKRKFIDDTCQTHLWIFSCFSSQHWDRSLPFFSEIKTYFSCLLNSMLADKLNMSPEEAERWIVNLICNARLDAKIDSKLVRAFFNYLQKVFLNSYS